VTLVGPAPDNRRAATRRFAGIVTLALAVFAWPQRADASKGAFIETLRQLAASNAAAECGRTDWHGAAARLQAALTGWDEELAGWAARAAVEGASAPPEPAARIRRALGLGYAERGRFTEALQELDAAILLSPQAPDLQLLRATVLDAAGDQDRAAAGYLRAWRLDERDPVTTYYAISRGRLSEDDRQRAHAAMMDAYQSQLAAGGRAATTPFIALNPLSDTLVPGLVVGDASTGPAFDLIANHRYDEGVARLAQADPASAGTSEGCGASERAVRGRLHETAGRFSEARLEYAGAIAGTLIGRAILYVAIGRLAQAEGDFDSAVNSFAQAARLAPNERHVHTELATAYAAQSRVDDAFAELVAALLIDPHDADAHAAVGQLFVDAGRHADAIPALTRALELRPEQFERRYPLAMALTRLGRSAEAAHQLQLFERARRQMIDRRRDEIAPVEESREPAGRK
jgi:tetratricopeptide (TPR) repeat protein